MGQAKRRGTKEDRIAEAQARKPEKTPRQLQGEVALPKSIKEAKKIEKRLDRLWSNLTTPTDINDQILHFTKMLSNETPIFLNCKPELWSRQTCCDLNVTKYIQDHGGRMLCGYRIWYNEPLYIEGERHAVWTDGAEIRDVSYVESGEDKILFVPDDKTFSDAPRKIRYAFNHADNLIIAQHEAMEQTNCARTMSPQEAWETMPTYEQWLKEKRIMPNLLLKTKVLL
uniref:Uncharacterized protein n=1 Tax=Desulfovibrio sp. U5L TaxID=596152 RepID=I2Q5D7_9BACT